MGTIDQPLALSLALCVIGTLVAGVRHRLLQVLLLLLFSAGVVVSQSRVGIVAFILVLVYVILRGPDGWKVKLPLLALTGTAGWLFALNSISEGLAQRFADDSGSSAARSDALVFFAGRWQDYLVAGGGISASYKLAEEGGLSTSLESSILMYAIDIGVVFALLYFGLMAVLIVVNWGQKRCPGLGMGALMGLLIMQSYSALATRSVVGILIWTILGMLVLAGNESRILSGRGTNLVSSPSNRSLPPAEVELAAAMRAVARR